MQGPSEVAIVAWARLVLAQRFVMSGIEEALKQAGFPPLAWYDVLLELKRRSDGCLTPRELEKETLFEQYNLSRLIDRMEAAGLVDRVPYPGDKRRQLIKITKEGRSLQKRIWPIYAGAIERYLGSKLKEDEVHALASTLKKLTTTEESASTDESQAIQPSARATRNRAS